MKKRVMSLFLILSLLLGNFATAVTVMAASPVNCKKNAPVKIALFTYGSGVKAGESKTVRTQKIPASAKSVRATSSNKKVATVEVKKRIYGKKSYYVFKITAYKAGTVKITFKATVKGKKVTDKTKVTVVKYKNPLKNYKIGKKDYASKFIKTPNANVTGKFINKRKTVKCIAVKGWEVKGIDIIYAVNETGSVRNTALNDITEVKHHKVLLPTDGAVGAKIIAKLYNAKLNKTVKMAIELN